MPSGGGEPLGQAQVGPRARRHRGVGSDHDVDLVVVEMHGMGHEHVRAERAQFVEMDEGTPTRSLEVAGGVAVVRRHVERQPHAAIAGQFARPHDERVAHQIVADERHPSFDQASWRQPVEQVGLPRQHLVRRRAERHTVDIPSPLADRRPHADRLDRGRHAVGMRHGARFDGARDAVGDRFDRPEGGRQLVVVAGVGRVHRHCPAEDRLPRVDRVRDARVHQPVARQVLMGVHVAGCHQRLGVADHPRLGVRGPQLVPPSHVDDDVAANGDRPIAHNRAGVVHRHHVAAAHQRIHARTRARLLRRGPFREVATPCLTLGL